MVAKNNAVFRFLLDIKDFVNKGRKVIQINNQISGSTQKASNSMDKLQDSTKKTGDTMAANAVNFQTATQGMLNLTTAGVQTFTSFSNLDRAGNRLAQAQIGVSRATDLLNNKQLRLNELIAKGQGNSQKAVLLTNELATARADLLVKTDKLKIEEGALLDIQLLFVTNIANVMISSMQTVISLKNAHIGSTIKQIAQERLLSTTIFTKTIPAITSQNGAMLVYNTTAKTVINTNRLLMLGIPGIGAALLGVSLAVEAYNDNWGGFRDMVQSVLPFMRDQKKLLGDVNDILGETTESQNQFNNALSTESDLLFDLPNKLNLTADGLARINAELRGSNFENIKRYNFELSKAAETGQLFPNASIKGGFQTQGRTQNKSNVIQHEGDTSATAYGIPSFLAAHADTGLNEPREYINQAGNYVKVDAKGNKIVSHKPFTTPQDQFNQFMDVAGRTVGFWAGILSDAITKPIKDLTAPSILKSDVIGSGAFTMIAGKIGRGFAEISAQFAGFESAEQQKTIEQLKQELIDMIPTTTLEQRNRLLIGNLKIPGAGKFVGGRIISPTTGVMFGTKFVKQLKSDLANTGSDLYKNYSEEEIKQFKEFVNLVQTDENVAALVLAQDELLKKVNPTVVTQEGQKEFFENLKLEKSKKDALRVLAETKRLQEEEQLKRLRTGATKAGLSVSEFGRRMRLGQIGRDTLMFPESTGEQRTFTEKQLKDLKQLGGIFRAGTELFEPEKVKQAREIRKRLEAGIFYNMGLPTDTLHDKLILRSFGRVGGITLSSDDPLLRDISGFGERRAEIYSQRMIDPITGEDMGAMGIDIGRIADTISLEEGKRIARLQKEMMGFTGIGGRADAAISTLVKASSNYKRMQVEHAMGGMEFGEGFFKSTGATAAYQVPRGSIGTPSHIKLAIVRKDSFNNSLGGLMMNELNSLKGTGQMVYSSAHRSIFKDRNFRGIPGKTAFRKAISLGIKGNSEYMAAIRAIPDVNRESEDNMRQAHQAIRQAESIANDYIAMVTTNMGAIGFSDIIFQRAITEGRSTQSIYRDVGLLAASRRTNFDNVEIINKASSKLGLTNSQIFDIRFNSNRGDVELEDRLRWLDRRESMSTGASVL